MTVSKVYITINYAFVAIIALVFLYSWIFRENHPVPSLLSDATGIIPPSKGLSASFSEIIRGNLGEAERLNPYGFQIFLFFLLQLGIRALLIVTIAGAFLRIKWLAIADITVSTLLFMVCFAPLIGYTLRLLSQLFQ